MNLKRQLARTGMCVPLGDRWRTLPILKRRNHTTHTCSVGTVWSWRLHALVKQLYWLYQQYAATLHITDTSHRFHIAPTSFFFGFPWSKGVISLNYQTPDPTWSCSFIDFWTLASRIIWSRFLIYTQAHSPSPRLTVLWAQSSPLLLCWICWRYNHFSKTVFHRNSIPSNMFILVIFLFIFCAAMCNYEHFHTCKQAWTMF